MDNLNNNIVKNYNKLLYNSGPVSFNDYIDNKYNIIHEKLYNNALNLYISENFREYDKYKGNRFSNDYSLKIAYVFKDYKFIEIKKEEYYEPSYVIQINTNVNYSYLYTSYITSYNLNFSGLENQIQKIDLTPYWNNYQKDIKENKDYNKLNINPETLKTAKIIYINYFTGKIKMKSRYTEEEFEIDFNTYNDTLELDEDMKLTKTFTNLRNSY